MLALLALPAALIGRGVLLILPLRALPLAFLPATAPLLWGDILRGLALCLATSAPFPLLPPLLGVHTASIGPALSASLASLPPLIAGNLLPGLSVLHRLLGFATV